MRFFSGQNFKKHFFFTLDNSVPVKISAYQTLLKSVMQNIVHPKKTHELA